MTVFMKPEQSTKLILSYIVGRQASYCKDACRDRSEQKHGSLQSGTFLLI